MTIKRKIVLIIVEGVSDKTALAAIISKLIKTEQVIVEITNGDFTSEYGVEPHNIASKIGDFIKKRNKPPYFKASDYLEVIHLIDMDGAFVKSDKIVPFDTDKTLYDSGLIRAISPQKIIDRNNRKAQNINKLISLSKVWGSIPYAVYFFSCNIDHVLYNNANVSGKDKVELADQFALRYRYNPEGFLDFIQNDSYAIKVSYAESWDFIKTNENSLKRYTNINLIFSENAKNIKRLLMK